MSTLYEAILIVGWGTGALILGGYLVMAAQALRASAPAGQATSLARRLRGFLIGFVLLAVFVVLPLRALLPWVGSLLPLRTVTGYVTRTFDEEEGSGNGDYDAGATRNSLKYIVVDGDPYMVNNSGAGIMAETGDHVIIRYHEGTRWAAHVAWIGSDGKTLDDRPADLPRALPPTPRSTP